MRKGFSFSVRTIVVLVIAVVVVMIMAFIFSDYVGLSEALGLNKTNLSYGNVVSAG